MKHQAVSLVQGLTGSPDGLTQLISRADKLLPALLRLLGSSVSTARAALTSLVNLSQQATVQSKLVELNAPGRCMDYLRDEKCRDRADLLIMLLANLTTEEGGAAAFLQLGKKDLEGYNLAILLRLFLNEPTTQAEVDYFEHIATILPNLTRFQSARQLVLERGRGTLRVLASQLRSTNALRKNGCAGAIKNCFLSCEEDGTIDAILAESDAITDILNVLAGFPHPDKDETLRINLSEALLCLAKVPQIRKELWVKNAPELLKKAYECEEDPVVCETMEMIAELFLQDGFQESEDTAQGEDAPN